MEIKEGRAMKITSLTQQQKEKLSEYRDKWNRFLDHSFNLAQNIVLLVPIAKMMKSIGTIRRIFAYGGIVRLYFVGASKCGFPFGFPCGIFYLKKGYRGTTFFANFDEIAEQIKKPQPITVNEKG